MTTLWKADIPEWLYIDPSTNIELCRPCSFCVSITNRRTVDFTCRFSIAPYWRKSFEPCTRYWSAGRGGRDDCGCQHQLCFFNFMSFYGIQFFTNEPLQTSDTVFHNIKLQVSQGAIHLPQKQPECISATFLLFVVPLLSHLLVIVKSAPNIEFSIRSSLVPFLLSGNLLLASWCREAREGLARIYRPLKSWGLTSKSSNWFLAPCRADNCFIE